MRIILLLLLLATPTWGEFSPAPFLAKYGWDMVGKPELRKLDIPKEIRGPAFTNYQSRCEAIGMTLEPFKGRQAMPLYVCTLAQRTGKNKNWKIFAYLLVDKNQVVGAWLGTDAPIAPGLASLKDKDFGKNWREH